MGFFDSIKKFFGGHGVKVAFTKIERQDATGDVTFPVGDSVMKANIEFTAEGAAEILSTNLRLCVRSQTEEAGQSTITIAEDTNESGTFADEVPFPHHMKGGESVSDGFIISDVDIAAKLEKMGYADVNAAINAPELTFLLIAEVDVKGSPFDPTCEKVITLLPA